MDNNKKQQGQVGIIVVLLGIVIFTLGMATARRITTDIRTASRTEEGAKVQAGAESAVEIALAQPLSILKGQTVAAPVWQDTVSPTPYMVQASYKATGLPIGNRYEIGTIPEGTVKTVWLVDMTNVVNPDPLTATFYAGDLQIDWNSSVPGTKVEVTFYYKSGSSVKVFRKYQDGTGSQQIFIIQTIDTPADFGSYLLMRIKALQNSLDGGVSVTFGSNPIPPQEYLIEATAQSAVGDVRKKVTTRRLVGEIPIFFDYVLANSSGDITK